MGDAVDETGIDAIISEVKNRLEKKKEGERLVRAVRKPHVEEAGREAPRPEGDRTCGLDDIVHYSGAELVRNAYWRILRREPDPGGFQAYSAALRRFRNKVFVVWLLRNSDEGLARGSAVTDLDFEVKDEYCISDFYGYGDEAFILNAYKGIRGRVLKNRDFPWFLFLLILLKAGQITRGDLLWAVSGPLGARRGKVKVEGLSGNFGLRLVSMLPVAGYLVRLAASLLCLPMTAEKVRYGVGKRKNA